MVLQAKGEQTVACQTEVAIAQQNPVREMKQVPESMVEFALNSRHHGDFFVDKLRHSLADVIVPNLATFPLSRAATQSLRSAIGTAS